MTRGMVYVVTAMLVLGAGAPVSAQQPAHPHGGPPPSGATPPADAPAADSQDRPSPHMMQMCRQMMAHAGSMEGMGGSMMRGGMMGGSMMGGGMGTMPMMGGEPKQQAEMMAMRGEMMKAMGDIMLKYSERMRPAK